MYYNEENNPSNHLFHSMIQLARGLGVSNSNHTIVNANSDTSNHLSPDCNYSPIHSMPWSNPIEFETDYQRRKHFGGSLNLLNQIPLDPTLNEVGRYFTNHSDFTPLPPSGVATHTGDSSVLPYTTHRSGYYSNVKFPNHQDSYSELVETCQSLTQLKHPDYEEEIHSNRLSKLFPNTNPNNIRDESIHDSGKSVRDNDINLAFPSMYTLRQRHDLDVDTYTSSFACVSVDSIERGHNIPTDKHSELINTLAPKSSGINVNTLSQYYSNFPVTNTTLTNTNPPTNDITNISPLSNEYDQKFSYHSIKNLHQDMNASFMSKSENKLATTNDGEPFNSHYSNSIESPPQESTIKWWSRESQPDNKLIPFRHVWNQDSMDQMIPLSGEPETHSLVAFAELFKQKRIKLGATQAEVGRALGDLNYGGFGCLSQSTICRFESLSLSQNNMLALKPILQAWLEQAEKRFLNSHTRIDSCDHLNEPDSRNSYSGSGNKDDLEDDTNSLLDYTFERKRKRTSITGPEKRSLEAYFAIQPRPSSDHLKIISNKLKLPKSVVRVWFCNQRQKQKRLQTVNHACNGTSTMSMPSDSLCGLCKTSSPSTCSASYPIIHNHWSRTGK